MEVKDYLRAYYENYDEDHRLTGNRWGQVEYLTTMGYIQAYLQKGLVNLKTFDLHSDPSELFTLVRKADVDQMMAGFPVRRLHYVAADGAAYFMRPCLEEMEEETFQMFLKYHLTVCENPDLVGATAHALDIFRKL